MIPKEKAKELFYYYYNELKEHKDIYYIKTSKQFALIAVDEIIKAVKPHRILQRRQEYWEEVKEEIEKL